MKFKIGDRVRAISGIEVYGRVKCGDTWRVCTDQCYDNVGVDWDRDIGGHNCNGTARARHGWNVPVRFLELEKKENSDSENKERREEYVSDKKEVPCGYIFVARDRDGKLFAYMDEPIVDVGGAQYYAERYKKIKDDLFAGLKFEDGALKIREGKDDE